MSRLYVTVSGLYSGADQLAWEMLSAQTRKDFKVILIDPGIDYDLWMRACKFCNKTGVEVLRVPYRLPPGARNFDWSQWSTGFLLAESEDDRVFRLQSWRLMPANLIELLQQCDSSVGFVRQHVQVNLESVDDIVQVKLKPKSVVDNLFFGLHACYGDWCLRVKDYLEVNGIDEPMTSIFHFEDIDFELRWRNAVNIGTVKQAQNWHNVLFYVQSESREKLLREAVAHKGNVEKLFNRPCQRCSQGWPDLQAHNDPFVCIKSIDNNAAMEEIGWHGGKRWFHCRLCDAVIPHVGTPHFTALNYDCVGHRATIGLMSKFGRNLRKARDKALKFPMAERLQYVAESYWDQEVLRT